MTVQKYIKYTPLNIDGKSLESSYELIVKVLDKTGNYLLHKDILRHLSLKRQLTVSTKTRSEVRGGGQKPWRQKGTGKARAGSNRSPLWKGGGVIFGPKPKKVKFKLNKKERKLALQTLLYNKRRNIVVIQNLENEIKIPKTQKILEIFNNCNIDLNQKILIIVSSKTNMLKLSVQNLKNVELISASNLNTLSLIKAKQLIFTSLALEHIKETYCEQ